MARKKKGLRRRLLGSTKTGRLVRAASLAGVLGGGALLAGRGGGRSGGSVNGGGGVGKSPSPPPTSSSAPPPKPPTSPSPPTPPAPTPRQRRSERAKSKRIGYAKRRVDKERSLGTRTSSQRALEGVKRINKPSRVSEVSRRKGSRKPVSNSYSRAKAKRVASSASQGNVSPVVPKAPIPPVKRLSRQLHLSRRIDELRGLGSGDAYASRNLTSKGRARAYELMVGAERRYNRYLDKQPFIRRGTKRRRNPFKPPSLGGRVPRRRRSS